MKCKVIWSDFSEAQLDLIFEYYSVEASTKVATKVVRNLIAKAERLSNNPYMGAVEELLLNRKDQYRFFGLQKL